MIIISSSISSFVIPQENPFSFFRRIPSYMSYMQAIEITFFLGLEITTSDCVPVMLWRVY